VCSQLPSCVIDELLTTEVTEGDEATVIRVTGEVAYASCRLLQEALVPCITADRKVVLDFSGVTVLDSSGIGVILKAHRALDDVAGALVVRNATPATLRVLEVTGLQDLLVERPET
jgi:stage II sporulation protein AA (anti-sigma F factor antagonist)